MERLPKRLEPGTWLLLLMLASMLGAPGCEIDPGATPAPQHGGDPASTEYQAARDAPGRHSQTPWVVAS